MLLLPIVQQLWVLQADRRRWSHVRASPASSLLLEMWRDGCQADLTGTSLCSDWRIL